MLARMLPRNEGELVFESDKITTLLGTAYNAVCAGSDLVAAYYAQCVDVPQHAREVQRCVPEAPHREFCGT